MLAGVTVSAAGWADANLILHFINTGDRFRHVLSHSFCVPVVDGSRQGNDPARNLDHDFCGVDIAVLGKLVVNLFLNSLVGATIAFGAFSGEPAALATELAAASLAAAILTAILAATVLTAAILAATGLAATVLAAAGLAAAELPAYGRPAGLAAALAASILITLAAAAVLATAELAASILATAILAAATGLTPSVLAASELSAAGATAGFPIRVTTLAATAFTTVFAFASILSFALVVALIPALRPILARRGLAIRTLVAVAFFFPASISAIAFAALFAAATLPFFALAARTAFIILLIHIKSFLNLSC